MTIPKETKRPFWDKSLAWLLENYAAALDCHAHWYRDNVPARNLMQIKISGQACALCRLQDLKEDVVFNRRYRNCNDCPIAILGEQCEKQDERRKIENIFYEIPYTFYEQARGSFLYLDKWFRYQSKIDKEDMEPFKQASINMAVFLLQVASILEVEINLRRKIYENKATTTDSY